MEILKAFGLVGFGILLEWCANRVAWMKYYEGKREGREYESKRKVH